jgi:RNA polymerase sigma-70 factor (ECF subfamily)
LQAVVRNTYLSWRQRAKRAMETVLPDYPEYREHAEQSSQTAEPSALDRLVDASKIHVLRTCIEQLPADYREVIVMRELEEMSYKQISEVANLPVGTVMSRLSRARKRLAECVIGRTAGAGSGAAK